MKILLLEYHITKSILQHQQFVQNFTELSETIPIPSFMDKFWCFIKTRLRITANFITDEEILMGSESSAKLSWSCWCWRLFFVILIFFCVFFRIINELLNQGILLNIFTWLQIRGLGDQLPYDWSIPGPN